MNSQRWTDIKALFEQATQRPLPEREAFVRASGASAEVQAEVLSLLAHSTGSAEQGFLETPAPLDEAATAASSGQLLGAWELLEQIGSGGMGEVWRARRADGAYQGEAAVKLLKPGMDSAAVLARFASERQALARLDHPHIARLFDAGLSPQGLPFFVMELVRGQPIDLACVGLALEQRLALFIQLCEAVAYAHRHLLVHRDLKPGNVLVNEHHQVKLLDFGIAKALDPLEGDPAAPAEHTIAGQRPYTPHYASPEQVRAEPVDTATDIYSLGVLLYVMLTGARPYGRQASSPLEAARSVLEESPTRPSALSPDEARDPQWLHTRKRLEGDLDNILLKTLSKEAEQRYASVDALAADIRAHLAGYPVSARPPSAWYLAAKFMRRHRLGSTLALAAAVAILGSTALAWQQARRAEARFADLHQLAHAVLFDYHDLIEPLAGATPVRKRLVNDAIVYLDRLSQDAPSDRALRREMGMAYRSVGLVQRNGYRRPHLDDMAGALQSYGRAVALLEALVRQDASDEDSAYELALALSARAGVQGEDGDLAAALPQFERAATLLTQNMAHDTPDLRNRLELARTHLRRADVLARAEQAQPALDAVDAARRVLQSLAALQPDHAELPHVWVWVHGAASVLARKTGDWPRVVAEQTEARQRMLALLKKEPDNARYLEDLAGTAQWLMLAAGAQRDPAAAQRWGQEASQQWADLARRDPDDRSARLKTVESLVASGRVLVEAGAAAQGLQRLDEVRAQVQATARRWPDDVEIRVAAVVHATSTGLAYQALGRTEPARAALQNAAALAARLQSEAPTAPRVQTQVALIALHQARGEAQQARSAAARQAAAAALESAAARMSALRERKALLPQSSETLIDAALQQARQLRR